MSWGLILSSARFVWIVTYSLSADGFEMICPGLDNDFDPESSQSEWFPLVSTDLPTDLRVYDQPFKSMVHDLCEYDCGVIWTYRFHDQSGPIFDVADGATALNKRGPICVAWYPLALENGGLMGFLCDLLSGKLTYNELENHMFSCENSPLLYLCLAMFNNYVSHFQRVSIHISIHRSTIYQSISHLSTIY